MAFACQLQDSLRDRHSRIALEFASGECLETVLSRDLLAVESSSDTQLLTSILLLDEGGEHLWHGAAPSLPQSYRKAIDGSEIGPSAGSCGTAAYLGQAVYVTDIATDPLWKDYRDLAAQHGLKACWSTPIRGTDAAIIGTFAIYHLTPRGPTADEIEAIRLITGHVAQAIEWARSRQDIQKAKGGHLKLVPTDDYAEPPALLDVEEAQAFATRMQTYAQEFDRYAAVVEPDALSDSLKNVARDCRKLIDLVSRWSELNGRKF